MKAGLVLGLILSLATGTSLQAEICREIRTLGEHDDEITLIIPNIQRQAMCTRSLLFSGKSQVHCQWAFPYRAPEATQAFEHLITTVADCLGSAARQSADQGVNHPDFYDLRTFQMGGQEIGVSLKDKAALSETYVFLRVTLQE